MAVASGVAGTARTKEKGRGSPALGVDREALGTLRPVLPLTDCLAHAGFSTSSKNTFICDLPSDVPFWWFWRPFSIGGSVSFLLIFFLRIFSISVV
jgi:hypothetical protein